MSTLSDVKLVARSMFNWRYDLYKVHTELYGCNVSVNNIKIMAGTYPEYIRDLTVREDPHDYYIKECIRGNPWHVSIILQLYGNHAYDFRKGLYETKSIIVKRVIRKYARFYGLELQDYMDTVPDEHVMIKRGRLHTLEEKGYGVLPFTNRPFYRMDIR